MSDYKIPQEVAHQIAVGLYTQAGDFVAIAKRDNSDDYQRFKADYIAKQAALSSTPVKRRYTRNRPLIVR